MLHFNMSILVKMCILWKTAITKEPFDDYLKKLDMKPVKLLQANLMVIAKEND